MGGVADSDVTLFIAVQPLKASGSSAVTISPIVRSFSEAFPANGLPVVFLLTETVFAGVPAKAPLPNGRTFASLSPSIFILVMLEQLMKAESSTAVTVCGRVKAPVRPLHSAKALIPIVWSNGKPYNVSYHP